MQSIYNSICYEVRPHRAAAVAVDSMFFIRLQWSDLICCVSFHFFGKFLKQGKSKVAESSLSVCSRNKLWSLNLKQQRRTGWIFSPFLLRKTRLQTIHRIAAAAETTNRNTKEAAVDKCQYESVKDQTRSTSPSAVHPADGVVVGKSCRLKGFRAIWSQVRSVQD